MDPADNFPLPEWEQINEHTLRSERDHGRTVQYNGTLAEAQNVARRLSEKHGCGVSIHTGGACVAYLNHATRNAPDALFPA